jgi:hypothetical protein
LELEAVSDEGTCLRRQSERVAELIASNSDVGDSSYGEEQGEDAEGGPGEVGEFEEKIGDGDCRDEGSGEG